MPVRYLPDGPHRYTIASLTYPGSTGGMSISGCCPTPKPPVSSTKRPAASLMIIGVDTPPGCTELTRMFFSANDVAKYRIRPTTPCLAAL